MHLIRSGGVAVTLLGLAVGPVAFAQDHDRHQDDDRYQDDAPVEEDDRYEDTDQDDLRRQQDTDRQPMDRDQRPLPRDQRDRQEPPGLERRGDLGMVSGSARLGAAYGSPGVHINARGDMDDVDGRFIIEYPNRGRVVGEVTCLDVQGDVAWVIGQVSAERGGDTRIFDEGDFVAIGIRDRADGNDQLNFSAGVDTEPECGPSTMARPNLTIVQGNFVVRDGVGPRVSMR